MKSRMLRWAGHLARIRDTRNVYGVLESGLSEDSWEDNVQMGLWRNKLLG